MAPLKQANHTVPMTSPGFLVAAGLILLGLGLLEFSRAMTSGSIKLRGGARLRRSHAPRIFWLNIGFDILVASGGLALAAWGLLQGQFL